MDDELFEILQKIISRQWTRQAVKFLLSVLCNENTYLNKAVAERDACLKAIHKINKGKNEAIDALSEQIEKTEEHVV